MNKHPPAPSSDCNDEPIWHAHGEAALRYLRSLLSSLENLHSVAKLCWLERLLCTMVQECSDMSERKMSGRAVTSNLTHIFEPEVPRMPVSGAEGLAG
jgi:hypothetical protein